MSNLTLFSSSGNMPFWAILAVFLLVIPATLIGIATMWQFLQQKISDDLSARVTACGTSGKAANDLSAHDTKTFAYSNAELSRIYAEINNKLTAEIGKINSRDAGYTAEAQKILSMVNNLTARLNTIEEACRNDISRISSEMYFINSSIETLQNEMIRHYAVVQRIQPVETDQLSVINQSETSSQSSRSHRPMAGASSSGSSGSGPITFKGISLTVWNQFKQLFEQIRDEKRYTTEEMCLHVAMEIRELGGKIKKNTIQGFYEKNIRNRGCYISTLDDIGLWIDSKISENIDSNSE